jgi:hypothetical protein
MKYFGLAFCLVFGAGCVGGDINDRRDELSDVDSDGYKSIDYGGTDCDDNDQDINPGETEIPYDGIDNDCSTETPDDDLDGDTFGIQNDCDDENADIHPSATEVCDGVDNNCNAAIDESGAEGEEIWYADDDGDGYGDPNNSISACVQPDEGYASNSEDCNDRDGAANPEGVETCATAYDDNCDDHINETDADGCINYFIDTDGDGYGIPSYACLCEPDSIYTALEGTDCNDGDADISPEGMELLDDGLDGDCNGDNDGFGLTLLNTRSSVDMIGPRLRASGDSFFLAWLTEEFSDGSRTGYDGKMIIELDADDTKAGEQAFYSESATSNTIAMSAKFDFIVTEDYLVIGSGGVNGGGRTLRLDWMDRSSQAVNSYVDQTTGTSSWDDIQLGYSSAGNITIVACGLGTTGVRIRRGPISSFLINSGLFEANLPWSYDVCEYNDAVYNFILGASDVQELSYAAFDNSLGEMHRYLYYSGYDVADIEISRRTTSNAVSAMAFVNAGKNYLFTATFNESLSTTSSVPIEDLDAEITSSDGVVLCGVGSNGGLFLYYGNIDLGEGLTEVSLASGTTFDECAVAATNSGIVAVGARSGDSLYIGYVEYP